jgi:hypothetical protein
LSTNFPEGLAGGHKSLGGGQIPFNVITQENRETEEENHELIMNETLKLLQEIFS